MLFKKQLFLLLILSMASTCFSVSAATMIVSDVGAAARNMKQWAEEVKQWQATSSHYTSQINAYKSQLAAATGTRDIGSFVSQAKQLTADLKSMQKHGGSLNSLLTSGNAMNAEMSQIYSKYSMFDTCNDGSSSDSVETCRQRVVNKAVALEESERVQQKITDTSKDVSRLSSRLEHAKDSKETQDLANALSLKTVQLNTLTTQWEMNVKQSEMRDNLLKDKQQKAFRKRQSEAPVPTFH